MFRFRISDLGFRILIKKTFDLGFGIADFGFNGKAHGAEDIAHGAQKLIADSS